MHTHIHAHTNARHVFAHVTEGKRKENGRKTERNEIPSFPYTDAYAATLPPTPTHTHTHTHTHIHTYIYA